MEIVASEGTGHAILLAVNQERAFWRFDDWPMRVEPDSCGPKLRIRVWVPGDANPKETFIDHAPHEAPAQIHGWLAKVSADYRRANGIRDHVEDFAELDD